MRTLFQQIINEVIQEGGNAVPSAEDVRGDLALEIAKDVIASVSRAFGCWAEPAGSTGKKGSELTSGDIDVLMDLPWTDENVQKVTQWVKDSFPGCEMRATNGFKEISFGYPYHDDAEGRDKVAQVDLMFTGNINWRRWSAYSPSPYDEEYAEHGVEKAFKGLVQTVLLKAIASAKPLNINELPEEYQTMDFSSVPFTEAEAQQIVSRRASRGREDADRLGKNKSYWRYMWDAETGLMIVRKSFEGARGMLIDPKIQERVGPITSNVDEGLKLILGPAATTEVLKNPITLVKYLFSGNYPYGTPENLRRIHNVVVNNDQIKEMPGVVENFDKVWNTYANSEEKQQGEPAYSSSINERLGIFKLDKDDVRRIVRSMLNEYRDRKSYQNQEDAEFIERMNEFCKEYGYEPFHYGKSQGLDPEAYAKQIILRHNTFLRGINMDPESTGGRECIELARQELIKRGNPNPSMEDVAKFAATVPGFGRGGHYVAATGNADTYAGGNGSVKNGGFSGTAKVVRPYKLGPDRMKWFDIGEGDFEVKDSSEYEVGPDDINDQSAIVRQVKPGDVVDTWGQHSDSSENIMGGEAEFGGWVTPEEHERSTFSSKKVKKQYSKARGAYNRAMAKRRAGQKLTKKEEDMIRRPEAYMGFKSPDYNSFLTSRNTYYRGRKK